MYAAQQAILPTCIVSALPNAFFTVRGRTLTKCRFTVTSRSHRPSTVGEGPPSAKANAVLRGRHQRVRMPSRPVHLHVRWACVHGQFAPTMSAPSSSRPSAADQSVTQPFIGADTVLKLGAQTPARSAGNFFSVPPNLRCAPQFRGHVQGIPQWKNRHCENNTS